jgi:HEAT repeat protein
MCIYETSPRKGRLAKGIGSLRSPAIQRLIPLLRDKTDTVRAAAAVVLQSLGATETIPFIRQVLAETDDADKKSIFQKALNHLGGLQK